MPEVSTDQPPMLNPAPSPRYPLLDALRIVAMLDIVSVHINGAYFLAGIGLPVFIIVAVALGVRRPVLPRPADLPALGKKRAWRILWPWVFWSLFFGLNRVIWGVLDPERSIESFFYPWMLATGPSIHLWFLPFIFVAELVVLLGLAPLRRVPTGVVVVGAVALAIAGVWWTGRTYDGAGAMLAFKMDAPEYTHRAIAYGWTVQKSWWFGLASVALGVAVGRTLSITGSAWPRRAMLGGAVGLFMLNFLWQAMDSVARADGELVGPARWLTAVPAPIHGQAIWQWWRQFTALLCVAVAIQFTGKTPAWLMRLALTTMGVYLLHGWVNARFLPPLDRYVWNFAEVTKTFHGRLAVAWILTVVLVWLLRRTRLRRVL
ncbi:MAG: acyltransferase family protein [Planctomycetota bacterium]